MKTDNHILFCCASYENRSKLVAERALRKNKDQKVYVCYHEEFETEVQAMLDAICSLGSNVEKLKIYSHKPIDTANVFYYELDKIKQQGALKISIDITSFTKETLLILLKAISHIKDNIQKCHISYAAAKSMGAWLSEGITEIRPIIGYPGEISFKKKKHLVILAGFEKKRAVESVYHYEPDFLSIGMGSEKESINDHLRDKNLEEVGYIKRMLPNYRDTMETFTFSLRDINTAQKEIYNAIQHQQNCSTILCPLNNKISTLATGLLALKHPELQICYVEMLHYNHENYSEGSGKIIRSIINFND